MPELVLLGGSKPWRIGDAVVGGIGVAGSGGAASDGRYAAEAIAQLLLPTDARR